MHVLRKMVEAVTSRGIVLDLQVIRPNPRVECEGRILCEADGEPLFARADAARAAVELLVAEGVLVEEAVDEHDVLQHYATGAALVDDWGPKERTLPSDAVPLLRQLDRECVVRERCLLRRLRLAGRP